ncbi:protein kinase PINOID-like [Wolffia australiana]
MAREADHHEEMAGDSDREIPMKSFSSSSQSSSGSLCERSSSFSPRASAEDSIAKSSKKLSQEPTANDSRRLLSLPSRKPHRSSDPAWSAIHSISDIGPKDFILMRRLGSGDMGTVYLCRLRDDLRLNGCQQLYAMKVVDKRELSKKKKLGRAEAERRVLESLDHPFLPTLYAEFDAPPHLSCAVMEFCPGGDLYILRHQQPFKRFPLSAVRFYGAEVLLALEYLHMLGVVYRDLKPENVLIRSDGHIMLTDFDLSLESTALPSIQCPPDHELKLPLCLPLRFLQFTKLRRKTKDTSRIGPDRCLSRTCSARSSSASSSSRFFVAEPVAARSSSFVGTHEYVAPEVAGGGGHGAAVDWWAFGIFLYELAYGRTPFAGASNSITLRNIVSSPLTFPRQITPADIQLRDLIAGLLEKEPEARLGSVCGAAELKCHPFFSGVNFALLRSQRPPMVPGASRGAARSKSSREQTRDRSLEFYF